MALVGIIANPTSGKDIRRWVGQAQIVGNREKVNIVKRVMIGLQSAGVREVCIIPDRSGIGRQSVHDLMLRNPQAIISFQRVRQSWGWTGKWKSFYESRIKRKFNYL